jgi:GTPase
MMLEHLGMVIALNLKLAIVLTKIDCNPVLNPIIGVIQRILSLQGRQGVVISSLHQVVEQVNIDSGDSIDTSTGLPI